MRELDAKEKRIKSLEQIIEQNKEFCEQLEKKVKNFEQRVESETKETESALTMQLMAHLFEFCQLFRTDDAIDDARRQQKVCRLLDASEDLLNCASILVASNPLPNQPIRSNQLNALNQSEAPAAHWSPRAPGMPQSRDLDSESDDLWSEPDRKASRARIGLSEFPVEHVAENRRRSGLSRRRRLQSVGEP